MNKPNGFWKNKENQRNFMNNLAKELGINHPKDWGEITIRQVIRKGGSSILTKNNNSLFKSLKSIYSEISWRREWFNNTPNFPSGYWKNYEYCKIFLLKLANKLHLKKPQDWGRISLRQVNKEGGRGLFNFHKSLFSLLADIFPDISWKREWFKNTPKVNKGFWKISENQRNFLIQIEKDFKIKCPSDWGKVTKYMIHNKGGAGLISAYSCAPIYQILMKVFPEIKWEKKWFIRMHIFPLSFWKNENNQRYFLDSIAMQYDLKEIKDWQKISLSLIKSKGGKGLLTKHHHSLLNALSYLYPNINWSLFQHKQNISSTQRLLERNLIN